MEGKPADMEEESETTKTLFQCKMCDFQGTSKDEIANHFIYTHFSVEIIESPVKSKSGQVKQSTPTKAASGKPPTKTSSKETPPKSPRTSQRLMRTKVEPKEKSVETKEKTTKQTTKKAKPKQKEPELPQASTTPSGRPQRTRRAPKWMDESEVEIIGMRKATPPSAKKTPTAKMVVVKVEPEDDYEPDGKKDGNQGGDMEEEEMEENAEEEWEPGEEEEAGDDGDREDTSKMDGDGQGDDAGDAEQTDTGDDIATVEKNADKADDTSAGVRFRTEEEWVKILIKQLVPITIAEFDEKVNAAMTEWETKSGDELNLNMTKCSKPTCGETVYKQEGRIHESCHMKDYEGFECIYCDERLAAWKQMRKHIGSLHSAEKDIIRFWKCSIPKCHRIFKNDVSFKKHMRSCHIMPEIGQSILASFALSQLSQDSKSKHGAMKPKRGRGRPSLLKTLGEEEDLDEKPPREKRQILQWMPTCGKCAAVYDTTDELDAHFALHKTDDQDRILCTECKEYFSEEGIREHMKKKHRRVIMPFRCVLCEFSSDRRHDVKKHMYCHEGFKRFQCSECGKMMSTPYNLKIHKSRLHAKEDMKKILCSLCGYKCANRAVLKDHMRHKHSLTMKGHSRADTSKEQYPTFPCTQCGYVGKKEASLKYHMRLHTEERPFKCGLCAYASKTKNNLILHLRTHKGMAPHKCPNCDFRGATSLIVKEHHMAKHTKLKPLKCSICEWSTCYNGNMWKHMQMHKIKEGVLLAGKPKRATDRGIKYELPKPHAKLLPITIDGFEVTPDQPQTATTTTAAASKAVDNSATPQITYSSQMSLPITIGSMGDGTTIVMVPEVQEKVAMGTQQEQIDESAAQVVNFKPGDPDSSMVSHGKVTFELSQSGSKQQDQEEVVLSVSGSDNQNIQQSISSIITSMAASAAADQQSTQSAVTPASALIETQLSASEVASHFEDGTIIEITQIPTSGDGTALIPEGAIVEKISPGMSASDIIMRAANMVASGQVPRSTSSEYQYSFPVPNKSSHSGGNTLPFLAHVATAQESLPEADSIQIIEEVEEVNMVSGVEGVCPGEEPMEQQEGEMEQQLTVATILPDEDSNVIPGNVMQIIEPTTQDE